jgi:hypothetical protein
VFILLLAGLTSVGMYILGMKGLGFAAGAFGAAVIKVLEGIGIALVFCLVNLAAGTLIVLAARRLTGGFVSLYLVSDVTLLVLSLIQGLTFQYWRELSRHGGDADR